MDPITNGRKEIQAKRPNRMKGKACVPCVHILLTTVFRPEIEMSENHSFEFRMYRWIRDALALACGQRKQKKEAIINK